MRPTESYDASSVWHKGSSSDLLSLMRRLVRAVSGPRCDRASFAVVASAVERRLSDDWMAVRSSARASR